MDLVQALASSMGIDATQAQAVAGLVLGTAKAQAGEAEAAKLDEAVPELDGWVAEAKTAAADDTDEPGMMDDLARFASSGLGGSLIGAVGGQQAAEQAQLIALVSKLGLSPSHAALAAPVMLSFLKERLGETWFGRLMAAAPILTGVQQAAAAEPSAAGGLGSVASALGGLFGSK